MTTPNDPSFDAGFGAGYAAAVQDILSLLAEPEFRPCHPLTPIPDRNPDQMGAYRHVGYCRHCAIIAGLRAAIEQRIHLYCNSEYEMALIHYNSDDYNCDYPCDCDCPDCFDPQTDESNDSEP